jgi:hypothetical protein
LPEDDLRRWKKILSGLSIPPQLVRLLNDSHDEPTAK